MCHQESFTGGRFMAINMAELTHQFAKRPSLVSTERLVNLKSNLSIEFESNL
jgi:hypothetical protein